jgi:RNA polymerase sigma-70 factor (ECF subfamily)
MEQTEPNAFDEVVREHGQSVWRLIVRVLGSDGQDAADCFQQAFVELLSRHKQEIRNAGSLFKRIAATRAIDAIRRRIRERSRSQDLQESPVQAHPRFEPGTQAEADELLEDLRNALGELPELQSAAFVMTQIEDVSHEEAAGALGITVNHLGVLLHRARATLCERLESHRPLRESRP